LLRILFLQNAFPVSGLLLYGPGFFRIDHGMSNSNSAAPPKVGAGEMLVAHLRAIPLNVWRWVITLLQRPRASPPWTGFPGIAVVVAVVALVVASMFFLDTATTAWARNLPPWLKAVAEPLTDYGRSSTFIVPLGFVLVVIAALITPRLPVLAQGALAMLAVRFGFLLVAIGLPSLFVTIVKRLIGRARPYVGAHDDPFTYVPFIWDPKYASMPSGHATTAAAAAFAIGALWPRLRPLAWLYAVIIVCTRIVLVAHHPSDVLAGLLVGVVGAALVRRWFAARCLAFSPRDLAAYGWPSWRRVKGAVRAALR
jgi:membrane-associated phospholipid phosphatase